MQQSPTLYHLVLDSAASELSIDIEQIIQQALWPLSRTKDREDDLAQLRAFSRCYVERTSGLRNFLGIAKLMVPYLPKFAAFEEITPVEPESSFLFEDEIHVPNAYAQTLRLILSNLSVDTNEFILALQDYCAKNALTPSQFAWLTCNYPNPFITAECFIRLLDVCMNIYEDQVLDLF
jgi:hypothetical protein